MDETLFSLFVDPDSTLGNMFKNIMVSTVHARTCDLKIKLHLNNLLSIHGAVVVICKKTNFKENKHFKVCLVKKQNANRNHIIMLLYDVKSNLHSTVV